MKKKNSEYTKLIVAARRSGKDLTFSSIISKIIIEYQHLRNKKISYIIFENMTKYDKLLWALEPNELKKIFKVKSKRINANKEFVKIFRKRKLIGNLVFKKPILKQIKNTFRS
ncbi:MAG TPA: hypothetical protein VMW66_02255 [Elusimicrobiales bacterium]|nr:hypothetical protein [Elusimicrobiales bacterium]